MAVLLLGVQVAAFTLQPASVRSVAHGQVLDYATDITSLELLAQTNQQRADNGLAPLKLNAELDDSASMKAADMFAEDYWAHVSPSGIQPWYWFTKAGYSYSYAGENLAKDFATTSGVMTGWMNSPGHRANILNPHYVDVGFAVENGTLVGGQTTLVVAHYGAPAQVATVASIAPQTPVPSVAPVPVATPVQSSAPATPAPTAAPAPKHTVVASGQISPGEPSAKSYSLFAPLSLLQTAPAGTLVTIFLLLVLLLVYVFTHMTVWRKGLKRWRSGHYRLYAAAQLTGLTVVILVLATSGFGKVG
ncbi:MAG TPA: CAP domain-containing protein [Candidatus Saccharimonadia bacterium]|nr:CAP domain-containing protein [Candidatus Saccharimonadia bacterium]